MATSNNEHLDLYLLSENLPNTIKNVTQLLDSSYYNNNYIDKRTNVKYDTNFYLQQSESLIYLVVNNPTDQALSFRMSITVKDNASSATTQQIGNILGVVFSAILTVIFTFSSIYLWMEYLGKIKSPRVLTPKFEDTIENIRENALTWELVLFAVGSVMLLSGYGNLLVGSNTFGLFIGVVAFLIAYYSYSKRQRIAKKVHEVLLNNKEIGLKDLAQLIGESVDDTKKALLDSIMYNNLPATFDFKTELVKYNPEKRSKAFPEVMVPTVEEASFQIASSEVASRQIIENDEKVKRSLPRCAYCDAEAISVNAQFCHSCGASMSSAK